MSHQCLGPGSLWVHCGVPSLRRRWTLEPIIDRYILVKRNRFKTYLKEKRRVIQWERFEINKVMWSEFKMNLKKFHDLTFFRPHFKQPPPPTVWRGRQRHRHSHFLHHLGSVGTSTATLHCNTTTTIATRPTTTAVTSISMRPPPLWCEDKRGSRHRYVFYTSFFLY